MIRIMKFAVRLLACLCLFVTALSCTNQPGKRSVLNRRGANRTEYLVLKMEQSGLYGDDSEK